MVGRVGGLVEQRPEGGYGGGTVGEDVMQLQERADPSVWQAGQEKPDELTT